MKRIDPRLLLGNAIGFYQVAECIANGGLSAYVLWPPFFFNIGHALELSLKAYILQRGGTEQDCRKLGHDLEAAMSAAQTRGLLKPHRDVTEFLRKINPPYCDHHFRYLTDIDSSILPTVSHVLDATKQHLDAVVSELPELFPT